jgi:hypothetical protein
MFEGPRGESLQTLEPVINQREFCRLNLMGSQGLEVVNDVAASFEDMARVVRQRARRRTKMRSPSHQSTPCCA